ncbi:MAG: hypothetical protein HRF42_14520 [Candidatus Brocadia sp.]
MACALPSLVIANPGAAERSNAYSTIAWQTLLRMNLYRWHGSPMSCFEKEWR